MILSCLVEREVSDRERIILDTLWDIIGGQVPVIEGLTEEETKTLFTGGHVSGIANPFLALAPDMEVKPLDPMLLKTTVNVRERDRQMAVHHMYNNINNMLRLLSEVAERLTIEDMANTY